MQNLRLTDRADLGVIYDATCRRHQPNEWEKMTAGVVTRDVFIAHCIAKNFPTLGFECDGKPIGGLIFDGNAAHLEVLPEYHGRWGLLWKRALEWIFSHKDPILVKIDIGNEKCVRFMDRNNWPRVAVDAEFITYEMSSAAEPHYLRRRRRQAAETNS